MNWVDIALVVIIVGVGYVGTRQGLIKRLCVSLSVALGFLMAGWSFGRFAFLSSGSSGRLIMLFILLATLLLMCYSGALALGGWIEQRWHLPKKGVWHVTERVSSALLAGLTVCLTMWCISVMFGSSTPGGVQRQLNGSFILHTLGHTIETPQLFRQVVHILEPFGAPTAFAQAEPSFNNAISGVDQQFDQLDQTIARVEPAVVKIQAWGCGGTDEGSGFLISKNEVVTNAHVIAGSGTVYVHDSQATYPATPIWFDPGLDIAVLLTNTSLSAAPLALHTAALKPGDVGAVLGYPGNGSLVVNDATVLQLLRAEGYDIYGQHKVQRNIYAIRSAVVPGNSGGPLVTPGGQVAGLVFGNSSTQSRTGYVIAADQLIGIMQKLGPKPAAVGVGSCTGS